MKRKFDETIKELCSEQLELNELMNEPVIDELFELLNNGSSNVEPIQNKLPDNDTVIDKELLQKESCPICMEDLENTNITITKCGHKFYHTCIDAHSYLNDECPICRKNMGTKMKARKICNCEIVQSVNLSILESHHYLNNLCKRLIKNVFKLINDHKEDIETEIYGKVERKDTDQEYIYVINKILKILGEKDEFKKKTMNLFHHNILNYTIVNSNQSCLKLRSIFEQIDNINPHH